MDLLRDLDRRIAYGVVGGTFAGLLFSRARPERLQSVVSQRPHGSELPTPVPGSAPDSSSVHPACGAQVGESLVPHAEEQPWPSQHPQDRR